ncbi:MAG: hypothetical protein M1833_001571 [Piccolia ochrophora]|nr:MAG: hypothetical protein M1833_001571 [Piccolia ochrophora]
MSQASMEETRLPIAEGATQHTAADADEDVSIEKQDNDAGSMKAIYLAFSGLAVVTLAAALDATSLGVALPIMSNTLHGTALEAFWSGTSFLLTSTVFQPVLGALSHIFGRKPFVLGSVAIFAVGCIIAAVANNFTVILVGRAIQGVGGGGIIVLTEILVTDLAPLRQRGNFFGLIAAMWAIGSVSGPLVGAGFAQNVTWRWIFWINLPFCGVGFILIPVYLRLRMKRSSLLSKFKRLDYVGGTLFIGSTTSFLLSVTFGGVMFRWSSWRIIVPMVIGIAGLIVFYFYERHWAAEPLIRFQTFQQRTAAANYLGTFLHGLIVSGYLIELQCVEADHRALQLWCLIYFLPLYYQGVKDQSAIHSSLSVFPETFTVAPAAVVAGVVTTITGRFRWAIWSGWVLTALGTGLLQLMDVDTSTAVWVVINLVLGLGLGLLFPSVALAIQAAASNSDVGYAVSMFTFLRSFGQTMGVAVGGVVFQNALSTQLAEFPNLAEFADTYSQDAVAVVELIKQLPKGSEQRANLVWAYAQALKKVWWLLLAFALVAVVAAAFTEELSMEQALETEQGLRDKAKKEKDPEREA